MSSYLILCSLPWQHSSCRTACASATAPRCSASGSKQRPMCTCEKGMSIRLMRLLPCWGGQLGLPARHATCGVCQGRRCCRTPGRLSLNGG